MGTELNKLKVFFNDASAVTFTDRTLEAYEYNRDTFTMPLEFDPSVDYMYVGRTKPFHAIYVEISVANAVSTTLSAEYYDGTTWTALALPVEDTKAFQRSGFIKCEVPLEDSSTRTLLWEENAVNSVTRFWIRFKVAADLTSTTALKGINIVFSDDEDLKSEDYGILNYLPKDEYGTAAASHILSHLAAKNIIIDQLQRSGRYKTTDTGSVATSGEGLIVAIDEWDLHDIAQVRQASKFFALEKIYREASDSVDDVHWSKAEKFGKMASHAMELFTLSLDSNDDGEESSDEREATQQGGRFIRG